MKRILLFVATNLAVVLVLGIVTSIILPTLGLNTSGFRGLFVFALIFGFGGAFISLAISKWMALRSTGAQVIEQPRNATEHWLMETVNRQAQNAGIAMPQVAIYDAPDVNAFATGPSRNNALVAVSSGLLRNMSQDEAEAVLGPRDFPCSQWRYGDLDSDSRCRKHIRDLYRTGYRYGDR